MKVINLGLRAIDPDPEPDARQFFIGYSYDAFRQLCGDISEAVSYTHLDVYKRQGLHRAASEVRSRDDREIRKLRKQPRR